MNVRRQESGKARMVVKGRAGGGRVNESHANIYLQLEGNMHIFYKVAAWGLKNL